MREMKNSGIEWMGEIPVGWEIIKLKMAYVSSNAGEVIDKSFWNSGNELLYTCQKTPMMSNFMDFPFNKRTTDDDLLLTRNATPYIFIPEGNAIYSNVVQRITISSKYERRFVRYALQCGIEALTVQGDTIPSYNMQVWNNVYIPNIPRPQQHRIFTYLDTKCEKIDSIIARQQEVIEKLKAYKLSVITEAVTKGLNPDVRMKDSGYEFIGAVPQHWNVCRLRNIGTPQNGISKGGEFFGHGYPFVSYGDVYRNFTLPENINGLVDTTEAERMQYSVKSGDIFFTRTSETIEEVGFSCVCEKPIENATFAGFVIRVRPFTDDLLTSYAKYYFRSNHHRFYLAKEMNLVTRASLGQNLLKSSPVLLPPKSEQQKIADYLDKKCSAIDSAIAKKQAIIEKLTAYKKSLIYEVVTGKREV